MNSQINVSKPARIVLAAFGMSLFTTVGSGLHAQSTEPPPPPPPPPEQTVSQQPAPTPAAVPPDVANSVEQDLNAGKEAIASSDYTTAQMYFEQAFMTCESASVQGPLRAKVFMALGALYSGYTQDIPKGTDFMKRALALDENAAPDREIQNSLVVSTLNLVRESMGLGAPREQMPPPGAGAAHDLGDFWVMKHQRVTNAKLMHPVGFFIEVNPLVAIKGVRFYFRFPSDRNYQALNMDRKGNLYGIMIGCEAIALLEPRSLSYYIEVMGGSGDIIAREGDAAEPIEVTMLPEDQFQGEHPVLPGMQQPEKCNPDQAAPCPPWNPHCKDIPCTADDDCVRGKICSKGYCVDGGELPPPENGPIGIVIAGGVGLGAGIAVGEEDGIYDMSDQAKIQLAPGFSPSWMFTRLMAGYFVRDNLVLGAFVRFQHIRKDEYAVERTADDDPDGEQIVDADGNPIWDIEQVNYKMKIAGLMLHGKRDGYEEDWRGPMWGPTLTLFLWGNSEWFGPGQVRDPDGELAPKQGFRAYTRLEVNLYGAMYHEVSLSPAEKPPANQDDPDTVYRQHISGMEAIGVGFGALYGLGKYFDLGAELMYDVMFPTVGHNFDFQLQMQFHF